MKKYFVLLGVLCFNLCLASVLRLKDMNEKFKNLTWNNMRSKYFDLGLNYLDIFGYSDKQHFKNFFQTKDLLCIDFSQISVNIHDKKICQMFLLANESDIYFTGLFCDVKSVQGEDINSDFLVAYVDNFWINNSQTRENFNKLKEHYGVIGEVKFNFFNLKSLGLFFRELYGKDFNKKNNKFIQYIFSSFNVDLNELYSYESKKIKEFIVKHNKKQAQMQCFSSKIIDSASKKYQKNSVAYFNFIEKEKQLFADVKDEKYMNELRCKAMHLYDTIQNIFMAQGLSYFAYELAKKPVDCKKKCLINNVVDIEQSDIASIEESFMLFGEFLQYAVGKGLLSYSIFTLNKFPLSMDRLIKKVIFMNKDSFFNKIIGKEISVKMVNDNTLTFQKTIKLMFDIIYDSKYYWQPERNNLEKEIIKQCLIYKENHGEIILNRTDFNDFNANNYLFPSLIANFIEKAQIYIDSKKDESKKIQGKKKQKNKKAHNKKNNLLVLSLFVAKNNTYKGSLLFESDITKGKTLEECVEELKKYLPENEKGYLYTFILGEKKYLNTLSLIKELIVHNQAFTENDAIAFIEAKINNHESLNDIFFRTNEEIEKININEQNINDRTLEQEVFDAQLCHVLGDMDGENDRNQNVLSIDKKEEPLNKDQKEELKEEQKNIGENNKDNFEYYNQKSFQEMQAEYDKKKQSKGNSEKQKQKTMNKSFIDDINNTKNVVLLKNAVGIKDHLQEVVDILKSKLSLDKKVDITEAQVFQQYFENPLQTQSKPFILPGQNNCFEATIDKKTRVFYVVNEDTVNIIGFHNKHRYNKVFKNALLQRKVFCGSTLDDVMQQYNTTI